MMKVDLLLERQGINFIKQFIYDPANKHKYIRFTGSAYLRTPVAQSTIGSYGGTPIGIYAFSIEQIQLSGKIDHSLDAFKDRPYVHVFEIDPSANIYIIKDEDDYREHVQHAIEQFESESESKDINSKLPLALRKYWMSLGYDAIEDRGEGAIHYAEEHQIVIFNKNIIKNHQVFSNDSSVHDGNKVNTAADSLKKYLSIPPTIKKFTDTAKYAITTADKILANLNIMHDKHSEQLVITSVFDHLDEITKVRVYSPLVAIENINRVGKILARKFPNHDDYINRKARQLIHEYEDRHEASYEEGD